MQARRSIKHFPSKEAATHCIGLLLSQLRHPNVVQFLGVYFERQMTVPILVMEFLPTNLSSCIDKYGILGNSASHRGDV